MRSDVTSHGIHATGVEFLQFTDPGRHHGKSWLTVCIPGSASFLLLQIRNFGQTPRYAACDTGFSCNNNSEACTLRSE